MEGMEIKRIKVTHWEAGWSIPQTSEVWRFDSQESDDKEAK